MSKAISYVSHFGADLQPAFSINHPTGVILVTVLGMVAEMKRKLIRERQQAGIDRGRQAGAIYKGRRPTIT